MFQLNLPQWVILLAGSLVLIWVSRKPLQSRSAHGFYRFFAWEILLIMFMLNMWMWFQNPFAWYQLISWVLLIASMVLVVLGVRTLASDRETGCG